MDFVIPTGLAAGDYLLRAEAIALHSASGIGGAQFYRSCYQLSVTGSGTSTPAGVSFPGAYKAVDPRFQINIYQQLSTYVAPGPTVVASGTEATAGKAPGAAATGGTASSSAAGFSSSSSSAAAAPTSALLRRPRS